jgi:YD repeat-containing protein
MHAFWHACLRHFVQRTHHGQTLCNLTIVVTQLQRTTEQLTACWDYNEQHLITGYRDFDGGKYTFDYNEQNMPVRFELAGGQVFSLEYDALARPVKIVDPLLRENQIDYHRNSLRVMRRQFADGSVWRGEYDNTGRLLKEPSPAEFTRTGRRAPDGACGIRAGHYRHR